MSTNRHGRRAQFPRPGNRAQIAKRMTWSSAASGGAMSWCCRMLRPPISCRPSPPIISALAEEFHDHR